ncbi:MAG: M28 family peptidase [Oscillospiraceae bacterium]|nr:M28 family peptidase [Oscillospiraceae bacterium]
MKICGKREFDLLNKIGFVRMGGTDEEMQAAKILMEEIESIGLTPVCEAFEIEDADLVKGELEVLEPFNKKYVVTAYKLSENTPEEGLVADFYYAENMTEADVANCKGKIVLVNGYLGMDLYKKLVRGGAAAFVTMSGNMLETEENSDLFTRTLRDTLRLQGNMPGANIRMTDAFDIVKNGATKVKLTAIHTPVTRTSHNVIATIKGTEKPEEIISFGAHFDSVEFSTGVYDNGAGSVINMEIMRHFVENPPKRTVQFMWYGSEEMGLLGSKAWVKAHEDELKDHVYMINVDVAGSVIGYDIARLLATKEATAHADLFMKRKGYACDVKQDIYSSDSVPFADKGVPAINFIRFGHQIGGAFIHNRHDVINWLSPESLERTTLFILDYADEVINSVVFPVERTVPSECVEKIDKYLMKKEIAEAKK